MHYNSISNVDILRRGLIKFTSEFKTSLSLTNVRIGLSSVLNKHITTNVIEENNLLNTNQFILKKSKDKKFILVSTFLPNNESRICMINLFKWLNENAYTNKHTSFILDMKLDKKLIGDQGSSNLEISNLDEIKFISNFDEDFIFEKFKERKNLPNVQSSYQIDLISRNVNEDSYNNINKSNLKIINKSNLGLDFNKLTQGFLEVKYIGGKDYDKKINEVLDISNYVLLTIWKTLNENFTDKGLTKIKNILYSNKLIRESYKDFKIFKKNFPKLKVTIDLNENEKIVESQFPRIKDSLYNIIFNTDLKEGFINYDTEASMFQIKDAAFNIKELSNVELFECKIQGGDVTNCDLYETVVTNCKINKCNLFTYSIIKDSILENSFANHFSTISNSRISGWDSVINGTIENSLIVEAKFGEMIKIKDNVTVIEYQDLKAGYFVPTNKVVIKIDNK